MSTARRATARRLAAALVALPLATCLLGAGPAGAAASVDASTSTPVAGKTLFGLSIPNVKGEPRATTVANTTRQFGQLPVVRVFGTGVPSSWTAERTLGALDPGTAVVYTFSVPSMADAAAGVYDAAITNLLRSKPAQTLAWVGLEHEPEGHIASGEYTAQQYRDATGHVARIIKANGGIPTTILTGSSAWDKQGEAWRDYFSPEIDVLAWDAYNSGLLKLGTVYKDPQRFLNPVLRIAAESGKAFGWGEIGASCIVTDPTCEQRAPWLTAMGEGLGGSGAQFVAYWNRVSLNGAVDYSLRDEPSATAWKGVLAR